MAEPKTRAKRISRKTEVSLDPSWLAAIRKSDRDDAKVAAWRSSHRGWIESGMTGSPPKAPWADTNFRALTCCPIARAVGIDAAIGAVDDSADLRALIRAAADAAAALERRVSGGSPGPYTQVQEVLLTLANCIQREEAVDGSNGMEPRRPPARVECFDRELLKQLHEPALLALKAAATAGLANDAAATGARVRTKAGFGHELVALLQRTAAAGLRGEEFAASICRSTIWRRGPFRLERVRWADARRGRPGDLNAKLVDWAIRVSREGLLDHSPDFEGLAQDALRATDEFSAKSARNVVMAAADNRTTRRKKRPIG